MNTESVFRPSWQSFTGSFLLTSKKKSPSLASLSCSEKIKEITKRCFKAVALTFCIALDVCWWALLTVTIVPAIKLGKDHLINLISIVVSPIFTVFELFGHHSKPCYTRKFNGLSRAFPQEQIYTYEEWLEEGKPPQPQVHQVVWDNKGNGRFELYKPDFSNCALTLDTVKILLELNENIEKQNDKGETFLHRLFWYKGNQYIQIQKILNFLFKEKKLSINLNLKDNSGKTPLDHFLFIVKGDMPPTQRRGLDTPRIKKARLNNYFAIAELLIEQGAKLDDRFEEWRDAMIRARDLLGFQDVVDAIAYLNVLHYTPELLEQRDNLVAEYERSENQYIKSFVAFIKWHSRDPKSHFDILIRHVDSLIARRAELAAVRERLEKSIRTEVAPFFPGVPESTLPSIIARYC